MSLDSVIGFAINSTSGAMAVMDSTAPVAIVQGVAVAVDPSGQFLYVSGGYPPDDVAAFVINPTIGVLTEITGSPFVAGSNPSSVAIAKEP